jgi:hypothetical protein
LWQGWIVLATTGSSGAVPREGERKDDLAAEYFKKVQWRRRSSIHRQGQEKSRVFHAARRRNSKTGATYPWLTRSTAMVSNVYI